MHDFGLGYQRLTIPSVNIWRQKKYFSPIFLINRMLMLQLEAVAIATAKAVEAETQNLNFVFISALPSYLNKLVFDVILRLNF